MFIAPSILAADFSALGEEVARVQCADLLHIDVMDGHFVPNLTIGPAVVAALRPKTALPFDVHFMLSHPLDFIEPFARAGADILSAHIEAEDDPAEVIRRTVSLGKKAGIAVNPDTPASALSKLLPVAPYIYSITVMTVYPGFGGQKFLSKPLEKLPQLRRMFPQALIELDGGVNRQTLPLCSGADILVAGTAVFKSEDAASEIALFRKCKM